LDENAFLSVDLPELTATILVAFLSFDIWRGHTISLKFLSSKSDADPLFPFAQRLGCPHQGQQARHHAARTTAAADALSVLVSSCVFMGWRG